MWVSDEDHIRKGYLRIPVGHLKVALQKLVCQAVCVTEHNVLRVGVQ